MIPLSLAEIAGIVGGTVHDAPVAPDGVTITGAAFLDTRTPEPDGLFVAFAGERVDGHDHAPGAVQAGARAVLGSRPTGVPTVVVEDAQRGLARLAREVLERLRTAGRLDVVAVTGSQGKTSVKDMIGAVLADHAPTVATAGSFNNELGLPLTVLRATGQTRHLVLEMGARGLGHLTELTAIAPPDVSLVLNVGKAHIGEFGSQANIAQAKGELVEALGADGTAVLNADDPLVRPMAERTAGRVLTFGQAADADVRLTDLRVDELGRAAFTLHHQRESAEVGLRLLGEHQAFNAAATAAAALAVGVPLGQTATALGSIERLSRWRMELLTRPDGLVVLNDAYNANPDSTRAALQTLTGIGRRSGRRTVAVLGEMLELGAQSPEEHAAVGALTVELGVDDVVVVGPGAAEIAAGRLRAGGEPDGTVRCESVSEAADLVGDLVGVGDNVAGSGPAQAVVLVKASRSIGLEKVAERLLEQTGETREGKESNT